MKMREKIEETEYKLLHKDSRIMVNLSEDYREVRPVEAALFNTRTKRKELWIESDGAGYTIDIDGVGFEFVREIGGKNDARE